MSQQSSLLFRLADQFVEQQAYQQATQCLVAICDETSELPSVLAQARLRLAALLLEHYDNLPQAKTLLMQAEQGLRGIQGGHLLKCEVWDALATCHRKLGAVAAEHTALTAGLKACDQGATSKDGAVLARWRACFHLRLAEHSMVHEGTEAAAEQLAVAGQQALSEGERALCLLSRASVHLCSGEHAPVKPLLEQLHPLIEGFAAEDAMLHRHLRCHYTVVHIASTVAAGRINDLPQDSNGSIVPLVEMQQLLAEAGGAPWSYAWLPPPAVEAIGSLLHASLLRSLGKATAAAAHLAVAQAVAEQQLTLCGIDFEASEARLGLQAVWSGRIYCHLRLMAAEQQVLAALSAGRPAQAAQLLAGLTAALDRFPSLLRDFVPGAQMLLGHYAHTTRQYRAALTHFRAVLAGEASQLHDAAAVAAALAELQADGGAAAVHRALQLLQGRRLTEVAHLLTLPVHDSTAALLTNAVAARRLGDDGQARVLLTKALKTAHALLGNTQLISQVLNMLAPIQAAKGDGSGAEQMLGSAITLAKAQGDLPTLLTASRALQGLFEGAGDAARAAKQRDYSQRKARDVQAALDAAAALPCHSALLAWTPPKL